MVSLRPDEIRRTLAERVARRVQGHGISRASVDASVDKVLAALGTADVASPRAATAPAQPPLVAALSGRSMPDLASRVRAALLREGVAIETIGTAMSGSHNVVTVEIPAVSRSAIERVASELKLALTIVPADEAR